MSKTGIVCLTIFLVVIFVGLMVTGVVGDKQKAAQMKDCVAAGMQWKRDGFTNYYECVDR